MIYLDDFIAKYKDKKVDFDGARGFQCSDLARQRLKERDQIQYKPLGDKWVKYIALNPDYYLPKPLTRVKNEITKPNQIPKRWDIVILNIPSKTWHIAIVTWATPWVNSLTIFEQNAWKWSGTWEGSDACRLRTITYKNVLWRITR